MGKPGRPTKLDDAVTDIICGAVQKHLSLEDACDLAGVDPETVRRWIVKGEKQKSGPHAVFVGELKKARAFGKMDLLGKIGDDPSWQAKAWILERRYPGEFGRRQALEVTGKEGGPLAMDVETHHTMDVVVTLKPAEGKEIDNPYLPPPPARIQPKTVDVATVPADPP